MLAHVRMLAVVLSVLVAGWWSPCCCQSDWLAGEGARLMEGGAHPGAHRGGCCAKKQAAKEASRDCCPTPGKVCKKAGGDTTMPVGKAAFTPTPTSWVWVDAPGFLVDLRAGERLDAPASEGRPGGRSTLLGLGCALIV